MLNEDPEVLQFTGDAPFKDESEAFAFLKGYDQYTKYKVGRFAVIHKENGAFLGWCGLKFHETENMYDLGFRFFRKHWNQGYATECSTACLIYAFTELQLDEVIGRVQIENKASIQVLKKLGFHSPEEFWMEDKKALVFKLKRKDFRFFK